jgi:hypothetical protein
MQVVAENNKLIHEYEPIDNIFFTASCGVQLCSSKKIGVLHSSRK